MATQTGPRDELDWRIIEILRDDGRTTNKDIANALGISEANVAARIRWLRARKIISIILQRDLYSQGYEFQCSVDVFVSGRKVLPVARELARIPSVTVVSLLIGKPEIMVVCNARDRQDMTELIHDRIAGVKGVHDISVHTALHIHKYESIFADLVNR